MIGGRVIRRKAKVMHHRISFGAFTRTALVIDEGLLEANAVSEGIIVDGLVNSSGLPES